MAGGGNKEPSQAKPSPMSNRVAMKQGNRGRTRPDGLAVTAVGLYGTRNAGREGGTGSNLASLPSLRTLV